MEQNQPQRPFNHRVWAVFTVLGGLQQIATPYILRNKLPYPPLWLALTIGPGILALIAAVGFWRKRRWGLWLFLTVIAIDGVNLVIRMIQEQNATGQINTIIVRIVGIFICLMIIGYFYRLRNQLD